ncbi:EAL domain-containing protein [Desulfopila aestuarii]|uniref:EAL domain-containing protein n=1 Tax=Desulfopila aestuarii DSM 18488 TaxID=1121416 RepID=A0A1M7YKG6_9BACT|nr:EAL domain-containing protein [Desulfopila aestuarii]SHO53113.1 EAL domain-containing protein [Desulfopila aestuarii DSM 18488]
MLAFRAEDIQFSLDDLGAGYSSLSYLKLLPLEQIKIDQSFVRDLLTNVDDATIAKTIINLTRDFGMNAIAEGAETEAQQRLLENLGCHTYQSYLYARPAYQNPVMIKVSTGSLNQHLATRILDVS